MDAPFYELISFPDNEGAIGPEAAADLVVDFETYRETFRSQNHEGMYFNERYDYLLEALRLAAEGGLVMFS